MIRFEGFSDNAVMVSPHRPPLRCVIVDDNRDFIAAATTLLQSEGFVVVGMAHTIPDALHCLHEVCPDVTLIDVHLGEESGFELADKIAHTFALCSVPTILISARAEREFAGRITASPAVGFLPKTGLSGPAIKRLLDNL